MVSRFASKVIMAYHNRAIFVIVFAYYALQLLASQTKYFHHCHSHRLVEKRVSNAITRPDFPFIQTRTLFNETSEPTITIII